MKNLYRKGLWLEYFTVGYNVLEAILAITFGSLNNSIALIGFGLDSIVESLSGLVLIWRLQQHNRLDREIEEKIERQATKLVAITFWILGIYVLFESGKKLITQEVAQPSIVGILLAIASLIIMPILAWQKYQTGKAIDSKALIADSKETLVCSWLSLALLVGLSCNYWFGFWQADPLVGLTIVIFLLKEGWEICSEADEREE
ncbi:MAG: cation diffusion facilitator family transporter [Xenococcaceae cyanobacterium]